MPTTTQGGSLERRCAWPACGRAIPTGARSDAHYCSQPCRQAAWRRRQDLEQPEIADRSLHLAYVGSPDPGRVRSCAGLTLLQVEAAQTGLLSSLKDYDGWAMSTTEESLPAALLECVAQGLQVRVAVWVRGQRSGRGVCGSVAGWEPVIYRAARPVMSDKPVCHTFLHVARAHRSDRVLMDGGKPWSFYLWLFSEVLQARAGDTFDDLLPGPSGADLAWKAWTTRTHEPSSSARNDDLCGEGGP